MKRFLVALSCGLLLAVLFAGCGKKAEQTHGTSAAGHPEEMADSTRMDSAMHDTGMTMDTTHTDSTMMEQGGE